LAAESIEVNDLASLRIASHEATGESMPAERSDITRPG
jgi:hypothetical protein